jgi:Flp pilus assembly protein TadG
MKVETHMHGPRTRARKHRGVATIEFAICTPILFFLMLATAEIGRALLQYNTLVKTVRDGARYVVNSASLGTTRVVNITNARRNETRNLVATGNIAGTGTAVLPGLTANNVTVTDAGNGFVSVSATFTYAPILGTRLPTFGFGAPINLSRALSATVVMRAL